MAGNILEAILGFRPGSRQEKSFDQNQFFADLTRRGEITFSGQDLTQYLRLCRDLFMLANGGRGLMALSTYYETSDNKGVVRTFAEVAIPGVPDSHVNQLFESIEFWGRVRNDSLVSISHTVRGPYRTELPMIRAMVVLADQNWRLDHGEPMRDILLVPENDLDRALTLRGFNPHSGKLSVF